MRVGGTRIRIIWIFILCQETYFIPLKPHFPSSFWALFSCMISVPGGALSSIYPRLCCRSSHPTHQLFGWAEPGCESQWGLRNWKRPLEKAGTLAGHHSCLKQQEKEGTFYQRESPSRKESCIPHHHWLTPALNEARTAYFHVAFPLLFTTTLKNSCFLHS